MFTLLHISDLHRSPEEPVDNDSLISALLADCDRYIGETPAIPLPSAIIVSGDIIHGARIGQENWRQEMSDQYKVAEEFLDQLTNRFLNGDRSKIVIIPGNHDVCWNTSLASMEKLEESQYPKDIRWELIKPDSTHRWSWKDRSLYKVIDQNIYQQRMDAYWEFVENFYSGSALLTPIDRKRGYQLFELFDRQVIVGAFDSIHNNDCFSYSGAIQRGVIGRCDLAIRDIPNTYSLRIAVWHHSFNGPPLREDYMDIGQINEMIGLRFQIGLHGHQHLSTTATQYVNLNESQSMAVVSAGSLCAGSKELPRGVNRQYNLIVIEDDLRHARVHVRELGEGGQFARKINSAFPSSYVELGWQAALDKMGREIDAKAENIKRATLKAEEALNRREYRDVLEILRDFELEPDSFARKIVADALVALKDWNIVATYIQEAHGITEEILVVTSLINRGLIEQAKKALSECKSIDAVTAQGLKESIDLRQIIKSI